MIDFHRLRMPGYIYIYIYIHTWLDFSFSTAGTSSMIKGLPRSLHTAARYIRFPFGCVLGVSVCLPCAETARTKGRNSRSGGVRRAAILNVLLRGLPLTSKLQSESRRKRKSGKKNRKKGRKKNERNRNTITTDYVYSRGQPPKIARVT